MARDEPDEDAPAPRRHPRSAAFPPPSSRRGHTTASPRPRPASPRPWDVDEAEDDDRDPWDQQGRWARGKGTREKPPVYWRARDSLYFEPLVALAVIAILLVSLWAYTQNWPPGYVVESNSMQHAPRDVVGVINAGDIVLAQKIPLGSIQPYVVAERDHYATYGEWGDVLLYQPNGATGATPVIHRAILYLQWDPLTATYNATELNGSACGIGYRYVYSTPGTPSGCGTVGLGPADHLNLYGLGWRNLTIQVDFSAAALGYHSGFLTLGDNNTNFDQNGTSTPVVSELVEPGWIIGVARGMIPWFGAVKLLLDGNAGRVPSGSWSFLGLSLAAFIFLGFAVHWVLRREGVESELRREEEEGVDAGRPEETAAPPGRARRWLRALNPWGSEEEYDPDEDDRPRRSAPRSATDRPTARAPPRRWEEPERHAPRRRRERPPDDSDDP